MHHYLERMLVLQKVSSLILHLSSILFRTYNSDFFRVWTCLWSWQMIARSFHPQWQLFNDFHIDCKDWGEIEAHEGVLQVCKTFCYLLTLTKNLLCRSLWVLTTPSWVQVNPLSGAQSLSSSFWLRHGRTWQPNHWYDKVCNALTTGLDNLTKWYKKTDDSTVYFISLICLGTIHKNDNVNVSNKIMCQLLSLALDPNIKVLMPSIIGQWHLHAVLRMLEEA